MCALLSVSPDTVWQHLKAAQVRENAWTVKLPRSMVCHDRDRKIAAEGLHSVVWIITLTSNDRFYLIQLQH